MSAAVDFSLYREPQSTGTPQAPESLADLGVPASMIEQLALKMLFQRGEMSAWDLAAAMGVKFSLIEVPLETLKRQHLTLVKRAQGLGAVTSVFELSEEGRNQAREHLETTQYAGAVPVPIDQYIEQVRRQKQVEGWLTPDKLAKAYQRMVVTPRILSQIGPAVSAGKSLLIYGQPGNGKTFLAEALVNLDEMPVYIPHSVLCQGNIVRVFDPVQHQRIDDVAPESTLTTSPRHDGRWVKCRRPFLVSGGELSMDMLDLSYNRTSKIYEAPFQMKANNGIYMIDDFGRQAVSTAEVLNRWIVPMERRIDYLTFLSGGKITVPFETFLIFSTNLKPQQLGDEAFLRRIQYKMLLRSPEPAEYAQIFEEFCRARELPYEKWTVERFIRKHYLATGKAFRRCHPRDVVTHAIDLIHFENRPHKLTEELLDEAWESCFTEEVED